MWDKGWRKTKTKTNNLFANYSKPLSTVCKMFFFLDANQNENKSQCMLKYLVVVEKGIDQSCCLTVRNCPRDPSDFCCDLGQGELGKWLKNGHKTRFLPKVANPIRSGLNPQLKPLYLLSLLKELSTRLLIPWFSRQENPPQIFPSSCSTARLEQLSFWGFLSWEAIPLQA